MFLGVQQDKSFKLYQNDQIRCPNGKMFGHRTMFDRQTFSVWTGLKDICDWRVYKNELNI